MRACVCVHTENLRDKLAGSMYMIVHAFGQMLASCVDVWVGACVGGWVRGWVHACVRVQGVILFCLPMFKQSYVCLYVYACFCK